MAWHLAGQAGKAVEATIQSSGRGPFMLALWHLTPPERRGEAPCAQNYENQIPCLCRNPSAAAGWGWEVPTFIS